jgi:hypothetical protein
MVAAGYMAKRVAQKPESLVLAHVVDICSVSGCISDDFADYVEFWRHNGYWFFDSPQILLDVARKHHIDLAGTSLFFYEVFEHEFDPERGEWVAFEPESSFETNVVRPTEAILMGYDVVTFFARSSPECSPLSCNSLAAKIETNEHCLLSSLEFAKQQVDEGKFKNAEPGPIRLFAVYSVAWP